MTHETPQTPEPHQHQSTYSHAAEHLSQVDKNRIGEQAKVLSDRARKHRTYATCVLGFFILPSILAAIFVFIRAAEVAGQDVVLIEREIARERTFLREEIFSAKSEIEKLFKEDPIKFRDEIASLERHRENLNFRLKDLSEFFVENTNSNLPSFLEVSITRFGTLGIIAFALTLFVSLYRNNIRLAVFYEARADALRILLIDGISIHHQHLQTLSDSMTPSVDFGKTPSTPIEHATKLAEKVGSALKK